MKTRIETPVAQTFGSGEAKSFTIKQDHKTFRAFSDGLYSDKISSIIRELACNAIDIQRKTENKDKPFEIYLPCKNNSKFVIRDYGTGLSPNEIDEIYTTYGESTKEDNNDDIGGFGLGSKTPFAYADQYFVRSYYNGTIYTYCFYFNADEPAYKLLGIDDTDAPNGLEIYFDVREEDYDEFSKKAKRILPWLSVMPNIWGSSIEENGFFKQKGSENHRKDWLLEHKESILFENENIIISDAKHLQKINFVQGGVVYSLGVDVSDFETLDILTKALDKHDLKLILKCNIGTLELARSRESLSLTDFTKNNLKKMGEIIIDESKLLFEKGIKLNSKNSFTFNKFIFDSLGSKNYRGSYQTRMNQNCYEYVDILGQSYFKYYLNISSYLFNKGKINIDFPFDIEDNILKYVDNDFSDSIDISCRVFHYNSGKWNVLKKPRHLDYYSLNLYSPSNIRVICADEGSFSAKTMISEIDCKKSDSIIVVSMKKSAVPKNSDKKTVFKKEVLPNILNLYKASEDELDIIYISDLKLKKESVYRSPRNKYTFLYSINSQEHFTSNNPDDFTGENIIVLNKKSHEVVINDKVFKRKDAFLYAHLLCIAAGLNPDRFVLVNERETDALINAGAKITPIDKIIKNLSKNKFNTKIINYYRTYQIYNFYNENLKLAKNDVSIEKLYCKHHNIDSNLLNYIQESINISKELDKNISNLSCLFYKDNFDDLSYSLNHNLNTLITTVKMFLGEEFNFLNLVGEIKFTDISDYKNNINSALTNYPLLNHVLFVDNDAENYCEFEQNMLEYMSQTETLSSYSKTQKITAA